MARNLLRPGEENDPRESPPTPPASHGKAINRREIDLHLASDAEAKRSGRRTVTVEVLRRPRGRHEGD